MRGEEGERHVNGVDVTVSGGRKHRVNLGS